MRWRQRATVSATMAWLIVACSSQWYPAFAGPREDAHNRKIMHQYAQCLVRKHHNRASDMILADENNDTLLARYHDLLDGDCLGSVGGNISMTFGGDLYRYAVADALVNADYALQGPTDFVDRQPLAHLVAPDPAKLNIELAKAKNKTAKDRLQADFIKEASNTLLSRYGECIVRQDPLDARLWLITPPDTPEETSRINALRPAFSACLKDGTVKFNRIVMRGIVAINYDRLAMATAFPALRKSH
jgi:hypothetical protein